MALSRKSAGKIPHEAHELNTKTVNKIGIDADAILKKDIDLNNTGADTGGARTRPTTTASAFMMLAAILGARHHRSASASASIWSATSRAASPPSSRRCRRWATAI